MLPSLAIKMFLQFRILLNYHFFFFIITFILFQMLLKYDIISMKIGQGKGLIIFKNILGKMSLSCLWGVNVLPSS